MGYQPRGSSDDGTMVQIPGSMASKIEEIDEAYDLGHERSDVPDDKADLKGIGAQVERDIDVDIHAGVK